MKQEIAHSEDRIAELLATISHELRGPLASIKGYAATLLHHRERLPPEEQQEFLQAISDSSDRLEALIHRFLTLTQLEQGSLILHWTTVPLVPLLQETIATSKRAFPRHHFSLIVPPETPEGMHDQLYSILADPQRLGEVLMELLDNAAKYAPEASHIEVKLRKESGPIPHIAVQITDQGIGIPADYLSQAFQRFTRGDTSLTRPVDGLGLGLALCQQLVRLHGGTIQVASQPGQGSVFTVCLPIEPPPGHIDEKKI